MLTEITREKIRGLKILVVGDVILDEYIYGDVTRVSPEAPVPIVGVTGRKSVLGGAGNVAAGIAALGAGVQVLGIIGEDGEGGELRGIVDKSGIIYIGISTGHRRTTVKTRVVGNGHQIVRYDRETSSPLDAEEEDELLRLFCDNLGSADAVVVSDYAKGFCSDSLCRKATEAAINAGKPVVVDTKKTDLSPFRGATVITPNFVEFKSVLDMPELKNTEPEIVRNAAVLSEKYGISGVLVTRSQHGMTYVSKDGSYCTVNAAVREVFDVSGAGDTVVAVLAVFMALGEPVENAMTIANTAAGIAVGKPGTYAVTYDELTGTYMNTKRSKEYTLTEIVAAVPVWRSGGKKIVFTNGCYDILHSGHVTLLSAAKNEGDFLIVGLNSDASVRRLKGESRPVCSQSERLMVLAATEAVDAVVIFEEDTPLELIKTIKPDVLVKGGDYTENTVVGAKEVKAYGGRIVLIPLVPGKSSTAIVERVKGAANEGNNN